nr:hypothetical protein Iba_scaffold41682CG0010 [Ipomoea batatas]
MVFLVDIVMLEVHLCIILMVKQRVAPNFQIMPKCGLLQQLWDLQMLRIIVKNMKSRQWGIMFRIHSLHLKLQAFLQKYLEIFILLDSHLLHQFKHKHGPLHYKIGIL